MSRRIACAAPPSGVDPPHQHPDPRSGPAPRPLLRLLLEPV